MTREAAGSIPASRASGSEPPRRGSAVDDRVAAGSTPAGASQGKLYVIGRADLAPGLRAAQLGHACITWTVENGAPPDNLVMLEVPDEELLNRVWGALMIVDSTVTPFFEPDLDDALTAVATAHPEARRLLGSLPLAFRP